MRQTGKYHRVYVPNVGEALCYATEDTDSFMDVLITRDASSQLTEKLHIQIILLIVCAVAPKEYQ